MGNFEYDALKHEIRLGGVYIRILNKLGKDALSRIPDPTSFCKSVVTFIARHLNASSFDENWIKIRLRDDAEDFEESEMNDDSMLLATNSLLVLCRLDGVLDSALEEESTIIPAFMLSLLELLLSSEVRSSLLLRNRTK